MAKEDKKDRMAAEETGKRGKENNKGKTKGRGNENEKGKKGKENGKRKTPASSDEASDQEKS